jgi:hypothetical protein
MFDSDQIPPMRVAQIQHFLHFICDQRRRLGLKECSNDFVLRIAVAGIRHRPIGGNQPVLRLQLGDAQPVTLVFVIVAVFVL